MSSLQRYKKSGGFFQLLSLIETFGPAKKEKFLEMIDQESKPWGEALREKMLTLDRIFSWPDQVVIEIFKALPPKSMGYALEGIKPEQKARIMVFLSAGEKRKIEDMVGESKPKPEEIASIMVKVVEMARKMLVSRELHPEKFDEKLVIPEEFESKLEEAHASGAPRVTVASLKEADAASSGPDLSSLAAAANLSTGQASNAEVQQLQRTLAMVLKENKTLKDEVRGLKEKLEAIRRFAA